MTDASMTEIEAAVAELEAYRKVLLEKLLETTEWRDLTRMDAALAALN